MFSGKVHNLRYFVFGNFVCKDTALAEAVMVHVQHDSCRRLVILAEESLQHMGDELHRRVVVV